MTSTQHRHSESIRRFVAVASRVPLLGEAMAVAFDFAEIKPLSAAADDIDGLKSWHRPDALIVDRDAGAEGSLDFARVRELPVPVQADAPRVFRSAAWEDVDTGSGPRPEMIRNVFAGVFFARGEAAR